VLWLRSKLQKGAVKRPILFFSLNDGTSPLARSSPNRCLREAPATERRPPQRWPHGRGQGRGCFETEILLLCVSEQQVYNRPVSRTCTSSEKRRSPVLMESFFQFGSTIARPTSHRSPTPQRNGYAPAITAVSKPDSGPPNAPTNGWPKTAIDHLQVSESLLIYPCMNGSKQAPSIPASDPSSAGATCVLRRERKHDSSSVGAFRR
jgi:hypothetical protein